MQFLRGLILPACLAVSAIGLYNVYGPSEDVAQKAQVVACANQSSCALRALERTPFGHSYHYQSRGQTVHVRCRRSAYLVGDYQCVREAP